MNEKEFLKEHPSLKGLTATLYSVRGTFKAVLIDAIHKTQLDKQKVTEIINKGITNAEIAYKKAANNKDSLQQSAHRGALLVFEQLKQELGL